MGFFVGQHFLGNENRAVFALFKGSAHIFTNDADAEKLNAAKEEDQHNYGCIAGNINAQTSFSMMTEIR